MFILGEVECGSEGIGKRAAKSEAGNINAERKQTGWGGGGVRMHGHFGPLDGWCWFAAEDK